MGTTGNNKSVRNAIWILLIIAAIAGSFWMASDADAQTVDRTVIALGQPLIGSDVCEFQSLHVSREFMGRRMLAGLVGHGEGNCKGEFVDPNIGGYVMALMPVARFLDIGFGVGVLEHGDIAVGNELTSDPPRREESMQLAAVILIRSYWFNQRLVADFPLHFSTGGSVRHNTGKNFLELAYRF